ncbi:TIGR03905 family TSCPD domain-containing protein [Xylanibacter rarus]|uniref:ribonucleoside-diphosphate reductase n=1 Tax=Xylanibacter rarus TaxID=1676614 RepID=A0A8E1QYU3_9BACT|nr:TIGR03905 family TSCPD domain-containing protein [Xylanibacter rarus]KOO68231.1 hypothetical protein ACU52_08965 [Xylanibacter rarus]
MKSISYKTSGTCSQMINLKVDDNGCIVDVSFEGGCNGNLQGICSLVRGMNVNDVKARLDGIRCGYKATSCPDQLCRAIDELYK